MAVKIPKPEDTELNMTPMIDIVFQLIIFFLLSLKFKTVDRRIDTQLPKDRGLQATQQFVDELPMLTVKLFRRDQEKKDANKKSLAFTRIRVGNRYTFELPKGDWEGKASDEDRQKKYDKEFVEITNAIKAMWAEQDNRADIKGEIKTPRPFGDAVPHGDVIRVLDAFLDTGILDVKFEGAAPPMPGHGGLIVGGG